MSTHSPARSHTSTLLALVLSVSLLWGCAPNQQQGTNQQTQAAQDTQGAATSQETATQVTTADNVDLAATFPSWNPESASLGKLVAYVQDVTNKDSANYVEPTERLATFDMDGTLLCEKAPIYADYMLAIHRVLDDSTYTPEASDTELANKLLANANKGVVDTSLDNDKNQMITRTFANMTPEDFRTYASNFFDTTNVMGFEGMTYAESYYRPMAEVVKYLQDNDFEVYVVSACEREVARVFASSKLNIDIDHVIGTDWNTKATGQGDEAVNQYTFAQQDKLVFDGTKTLEVAKLNKVVCIQREIGRRPLLAFGNSSGDYAMLNYAQSNPDHKGMGLLVLCDDVIREYGDTERATSQKQEADTEGWTTFSMANDWAQIYGQNVKKTQLPGDTQGDLAQAA